MQIMITHGSAARSRVIQLSPFQLTLMGLLVVVSMLLLSGTIYHYLFQKAAREGWPVVSQVVKLVVRDEFAQRDRFMRENLDAMAQRLATGFNRNHMINYEGGAIPEEYLVEYVADRAGAEATEEGLARRLAS